MAHRYVLTVFETIEREVVVYADNPREAKKARRATWLDSGDAGHVIDYSVEHVDGPETESAPDCMTEWKLRCES